MNHRPTPIERAFILASSGRFENVKALRRALKAEGYLEDGQLRGPGMGKQLSKLILAAKSGKAADASPGPAPSAQLE